MEHITDPTTHPWQQKENNPVQQNNSIPVIVFADILSVLFLLCDMIDILESVLIGYYWTSAIAKRERKVFLLKICIVLRSVALAQSSYNAISARDIRKETLVKLLDGCKFNLQKENIKFPRIYFAFVFKY